MAAKPTSKQVARQPQDASEQEKFFLPDLCAPYSVLLLVLLGELLVVVHALASSGLPNLDWQLLANGSIFVQFVVLLSAATLCQLRKPLSDLSLPLATLGCLLVVAVTTMASTFFFQWLQITDAGAAVGWQLLRNTVVALGIAGILLRYFYLQQQLRMREQLELQSRLNSLRDRIRPHFLFNTLNSIASLIASRPDAAERAVEDLAELFRASLQDEQGATTVADELRLCDLYLGIEKLRLGDRLTLQWDVAEEARVLPMPSLILQPLVENAIYHGVSKLPAGGTVKISVQVAQDVLSCGVENPLPESSAKSGGHQMALDNISARLAALYGDAGRLEISTSELSFLAQIHYPVESPT